MLQAPNVCAVIVAAYQAPRWIGECLDSIDSQEPLEGWSYETRIGVDCCVDTALALKARGTPFWWSPAGTGADGQRGVGCYLIRNALIAKAPADAYAIFDADDVMEPNYLRTLLSIMGEGISGGARTGMDMQGKLVTCKKHGPFVMAGEPLVPCQTCAAEGLEPQPYDGKDPRGLKVYPHLRGIGVFSSQAMRKLGGFRSWRIRADADAYQRAHRLGIPLKRSELPLFRRRSHQNSLTNSPDTRIGGPARKAKGRETKRLLKLGQLHVEPECAALEWRGVSVRRSA